jgi:hypothetical protein
MKTMVACVLGLAALVTSFVGGGSLVYADALEAESSALSILAPDADVNRVESAEELHCVLYSDGADNCIVNVQLEAVDQRSTAVSEIDPSATESAPAVQFVDAIPVVVVQTMTIAAPGLSPGNREETAYPETLPVPATEPVFDLDAKTTTGALLSPVGQSADAIVVAIVQSATIAVPGQSAQGEEAAQMESMSAPTVPTSARQAKTMELDFEE